MTNFEKWKSTITAEELLRFIEDDIHKCENCPAVKHCFGETGKKCTDAFMEWADADYVEPPKKMMLVMDKPGGCDQCKFKRSIVGKERRLCGITGRNIANPAVREGDCPLVDVVENEERDLLLNEINYWKQRASERENQNKRVRNQRDEPRTRPNCFKCIHYGGCDAVWTVVESLEVLHRLQLYNEISNLIFGFDCEDYEEGGAEE